MRLKTAQFLRSMPSGLLSNLRWQYIANIGISVLGGLYLLLLGRFLGAAQFGLYSVCLSYAIIALGFADFRLQEAAIRFIDLEKGRRRRRSVVFAETLFTLDICSKLLVSFAFLIFLPVISSLVSLGDDEHAILLLCFLNTLGSKIGNPVAVGVLRAINRFNLHAIVLLIEWSSRLLLTSILLGFTSAGLTEVLILSALIGLVANLALITLASRTARLSPSWLIAKDRKSMRAAFLSMRVFILPSYGISLLDNAAKEADVAIVALFLSLPNIGVYKMTKSIVLIIWKAVDPFFFVIMPTLVKYLRQSDVVGLRGFLKRLTFLLTGCAVAMVVAGAIVVPIAVPPLLGPDFQGVSSVFPIMSGWILLSLPLIWTHAYAAALGRPALQLGGNLLGNTLMVILLFALTPLLGLIGAGIAWSIGLASSFVGAFGILWMQKAFSTKIIGQSARAR